MYRVVIDRKTCCGTSNCAEAAPEAYEMDDASQPHLLPGAPDRALLEGAKACPMDAISVYDEAGRRIHP